MQSAPMAAAFQAWDSLASKACCCLGNQIPQGANPAGKEIPEACKALLSWEGRYGVH
jgi:hypothetical protein